MKNSYTSLQRIEKDGGRAWNHNQSTAFDAIIPEEEAVVENRLDDEEDGC